MNRGDLQRCFVVLLRIVGSVGVGLLIVCCSYDHLLIEPAPERVVVTGSNAPTRMEEPTPVFEHTPSPNLSPSPYATPEETPSANQIEIYAGRDLFVRPRAFRDAMSSISKTMKNALRQTNLTETVAASILPSEPSPTPPEVRTENAIDRYLT